MSTKNLPPVGFVEVAMRYYPVRQIIWRLYGRLERAVDFSFTPQSQ